MMDIQYFVDALKEQKETNEKIYQMPDFWGQRGDIWVKREVEQGEKNDPDVDFVADFLTSSGMIFEGATVLDVGCGTGKHAAKFASLGANVTAFDMSDKMVSHAKNRAESLNLKNVNFLTVTFDEICPTKRGWENKFDLVFISNSPVLNSLEAIQKACNLSRGHCFNRTFAYRENQLLNDMHLNVAKTSRKPYFKANHIISLFSILSIMGYFPQVDYIDGHKINKRQPCEAFVRNYAQISGLEGKEGDIVKYFQSVACEDGYVEEEIISKNALISWNINDLSPLK